MHCDFHDFILGLLEGLWVGFIGCFHCSCFSNWQICYYLAVLFLSLIPCSLFITTSAVIIFVKRYTDCKKTRCSRTFEPFSLSSLTRRSARVPPRAQSWNIKGPPLNCQSVLFSYKRSFCHLHSFYCLSQQLTAQPRSLLLFPQPHMGAGTRGERLQQRKVISPQRWWPHYISNMNLSEHNGCPKQRAAH